MATVTLYRISDGDLSDTILDSIIPDRQSLDEVPLRSPLPARLFLARSEPRTPEWATYLAPIVAGPLQLPAHQAVGAVLVVKPDARRRLLYAATWGSGHFFLRAERLEPDLGLRCVANLLSSNEDERRLANAARVRSVRSKRVSQNTLISETQASRKAPIEAFPFRADVDQLRQITGTPVDTEAWGTTVTGGVSIHVKRPDNPANLVALSRAVERTYRSKDYRDRYGWIDNVTQIRDAHTLVKAYEHIADALRDDDRLALSVSPPSLVAWETTTAFKYHAARDSIRVDEPSLESLRDFLANIEMLDDLSAETLTGSVWLDALDDAGERTASWTIGRCLSGDLTIGRETYVLDDGVLYAVATDYLRSLNRYVRAIPQTNLPLPNSLLGELEGPYNERVATTMAGALLLDKKTIIRPRTTAVEICDVAFRAKVLLHVKKGLSSSSLSHLFAQGVVSAELLLMDEDFRHAVHALLGTQLDGSGSKRMTDFAWLHAHNFEPQACEVTYAVMTGRFGNMSTERLPFFSKVNLRMRCEELRRMGFRYSLALIASTQ